MADSATTPEEPVVMDGDVIVEFNEASSRQQINSGESVKTLFGKIRKFLTDLKAVAFSGAYSDLSGAPDLTKYALKSKYGDTTIDVGRLSGSTVGEYSTAEGMKATASGQVSKASGYYTEALGDYSYSGGFFARSIGHSSFAYGNRARTSKNNEVAFGIFNISNDDTLFSVGDGKADNGKHNAFEITTTGGKLHDKDIATTDLIPSSLPANGGNADTVGGKEPEKIFYDNGMSSDLDSATKSGCYAASPDTLNAPYSSWWLVDTVNFDNQFIVQKAHAIGDASTTASYIRNYANNAWSDWTEIYTAGNKSYVTGSATVAANNTTCTSNHGFTPSAVIWWDGNDSGVATSFNGTQFTFDKTRPVDRIISYLIFK